jgi:hypothetical protein
MPASKVQLTVYQALELDCNDSCYKPLGLLAKSTHLRTQNSELLAKSSDIRTESSALRACQYKIKASLKS